MRQAFFAENTLGSIVGLMGEVVAFLRTQGLTPRSLFIAELALEEMLTNTVKYAYDDNEPHRIEVGAEVSGTSVILDLSDDGHYFDPHQALAPEPGTPLAKRKAGGYGIHLVKKLVQEMTYRREGDLNVVRIVFPADAPAPAGAS
jgi:anti-sigma regulatory factor (Ser/Thr protein kinase)